MKLKSERPFRELRLTLTVHTLFRVLQLKSERPFRELRHPHVPGKGILRHHGLLKSERPFRELRLITLVILVGTFLELKSERPFRELRPSVRQVEESVPSC